MYSVETVVRNNREGKRIEQKMVFGTGRLTNDPPEIKELPSGAKVLSGRKGHSFAIAFDNAPDKKATFYRLEAWGKTAENLSKFGFKGQPVEIAGRLKTDKYTLNGEERTSETLTIERFEVKRFKKKESHEKTLSESEEKEEESLEEETELEEDPVDMEDDEFPF